MEPLMLIAAFFIFFFFAFFYVRLDFSISKDEGQEVRLKVSGLCEKICVNQVITIIDFIIGTKIYCPIFQDRRWNSYEKFDEALVKLKASKDVNAFKMSAKAIANDLKTDSQNIADIMATLKPLSAEIAEKVNELQRQDG